MADTTYATITDFKDSMPNIGVSDTTRNPAIQRFLNTAAQLVDAITKRGQPGVEVFSVTASATRYFTDTHHDTGLFPIDDAQTITVVTRNSVTQVLNTDYFIYPDQRGVGPITHIQLPGWTNYYTSSSGYGLRQIAITGTWGYCSAANRPPEIKEATVLQAIRMYERANLSVKELGEMLVNPFRKGLDPVVEEMIKPYRRMVYVA